MSELVRYGLPQRQARAPRPPRIIALTPADAAVGSQLTATDSIQLTDDASRDVVSLVRFATDAIGLGEAVSRARAGSRSVTGSTGFTDAAGAVQHVGGLGVLPRWIEGRDVRFTVSEGEAVEAEANDATPYRSVVAEGRAPAGAFFE